MASSVGSLNATTTFMSLLCLFFSVRDAHAADRIDIEPLIQRGKQYLISQQKDGNWEQKDNQFSGENVTGFSAISAIALVETGENYNSDLLKPTVAYLQKTPTTSVYSLGLRLQLWNELPPTKEVKSAGQRDARVLLGAVSANPVTAGLFSYTATGKPADRAVPHMSTSNYGVLGLWSAAEAGQNIPPQFWNVADRVWRAGQHTDGSWSYSFPAAPFNSENAANENAQRLLAWPSMTSAGIATLLICQDYRAIAGVSSKATDDALRHGIEWLDENFDKVFSPSVQNLPTSLYTLHNLERIGAAGGLRYIGHVDWFERGVAYLKQTQQQDGSWDGVAGKIPSTSFALMFLAHAHQQVAFMKLEYASPEDANSSVPVSNKGGWNDNSRDVAALARWTAKATEQNLRWEIVNGQTSLAEMLNSHVLIVTGAKPLVLDPQLTSRLRDFALRGGLIVCISTGNEGFAASIRHLATSLFPGHTWRDLPKDHIVFTRQQFRTDKLPNGPKVISGLSNGAREMILLADAGDMSRQWSKHSPAATTGMYQFGCNLYMYAGPAAQQAGPQLPSHSTPKPVPLARLVFDGNWDPEPAAFDCYNECPSVQTVTPEKIGLSSDLKDFPVAYLCGTDEFRLTTNEVIALRKYIDNGGTLILEATGSSAAFSAAGDALLAQLRRDDEKLVTLKPDHPLFAVTPPQPLEMRFYPENLTLRPELTALEIRGRPAVFLSRIDLSASLAGARTNAFPAWTNASAIRIMNGIVKRP